MPHCIIHPVAKRKSFGVKKNPQTRQLSSVTAKKRSEISASTGKHKKSVIEDDDESYDDRKSDDDDDESDDDGENTHAQQQGRCNHQYYIRILYILTHM